MQIRFLTNLGSLSLIAYLFCWAYGALFAASYKYVKNVKTVPLSTSMWGCLPFLSAASLFKMFKKHYWWQIVLTILIIAGTGLAGSMLISNSSVFYSYHELTTAIVVILTYFQLMSISWLGLSITDTSIGEKLIITILVPIGAIVAWHKMEVLIESRNNHDS